MHHGRVHARPPVNRDIARLSPIHQPRNGAIFFFLPASFPPPDLEKVRIFIFYETLEECNTLITLIIIIAYDGHNVYNDVDNIYFLFLRILLELTLARNMYDYYFERRRRKEYLFEFNFYRKIYSKKVNISRNGYKY